MQVAFDSVASEYDQHFSESLIGKAQRDIVQRYLRNTLTNNSRILEINCGTGQDAVWLAELGHEILATDASQQMIDIVRTKAVTKKIADVVHSATWNLNEPFPLKTQQFDVVFSNFGGLNCISSSALEKLSAQFNSLLLPGGKLIFVVMGRFCLMETIYFLLKGKLRSAFRRCSKKKQSANIGSDSKVDIWYYGSKQIKDSFSGDFIYQTKKPVGILIPPSFLENKIKIRPRLFSFMKKADGSLEKISWLSGLSDHYIIELRKDSAQIHP